jgi:putative endonuclease
MPEEACGNKQKNPRVDYPGNVGENEFGTSLDPDSPGYGFSAFNRGPVAQLGARFHGMEEVAGSIPARSTNSPYAMPAVYILRSDSSKRFYIGCADHPKLRLKEHNRGQTISTRGRGPWMLLYQEGFDTLVEARRRERQLKSWKSHRSIQELIDASPKQS